MEKVLLDLFDKLYKQNFRLAFEYLDSQKEKVISREIMLNTLMRANNYTRWDVFCKIMESRKTTRAAAVEGYKNAIESGKADYRAVTLYYQQGFTINEMLRSKKEHKVWESLPDTITLYRGCSKNEADFQFGISWTFNRQIAEFFAFRGNQSDRAVFSIDVFKEDIKALLLDRDEDEALFFDGNYFFYEAEDFKMVTDKPTEYFNDYMELKQSRLSRRAAIF